MRMECQTDIVQYLHFLHCRTFGLMVIITLLTVCEKSKVSKYILVKVPLNSRLLTKGVKFHNSLPKLLAINLPYIVWFQAKTCIECVAYIFLLFLALGETKKIQNLSFFKFVRYIFVIFDFLTPHR